MSGSLNVIILILILTTFQSEPKYPPSSSAVVARDDDMLGTYYELFKNKQFLLLLFSFTLYYVFIASSILWGTHVFEEYGFTKNQAHMGQIYQSTFGFVGSLSFGFFLYCTKLHKTTHVMAGILSLIIVILTPFTQEWTYTEIQIFSGSAGFMTYGIVTICFIYAIEVAYPLKETTVLGIFTSFGVLFGVGAGYSIQNLVRTYPDKKGVLISLLIVGIWLLLGITLAWIMRPINHQKIPSSEVRSNSFIRSINHERSEVSHDIIRPTNVLF